MKAPEGFSQPDWQALLERAMAVAAEGITIADARLPGRPLIYVNEGFERLTGYAAAEVIGRNCKFLQGPDTDPLTIAAIRAGLQAQRSFTVEILNHRKDGARFWNRLSITPVRGADGQVSHLIGIQSDVTERREAEQALRATKAALEMANTGMRRNLEEAAAIQRAWLPHALPRVAGYRFAWDFQPCDELAGDGLDIVRLDRDHLGLYVLDIGGHGVPAALLSASLHRWLSPVPEESCLFRPQGDNEASFQIASPAEVVANLNERYRLEPEHGRFCTLIYGVLHLPTRVLRYALAGHPPPLRFATEGDAESAGECPTARGVPIGVLPAFDYQEVKVRLAPGDRLLFYSDGVLEALNDQDEAFGRERLRQAAARECGRSLEPWLTGIRQAVLAWCPGRALQDDATLLGLEVCGTVGPDA